MYHAHLIEEELRLFLADSLFQGIANLVLATWISYTKFSTTANECKSTHLK